MELNRVILVVNWRRRTREVEDLIDFDVSGKRYVSAQTLEVRGPERVLNIALCAGVEVIHAQHFVPFGEQTLA